MANRNSIKNNLLHRAELKSVGKPVNSAFNEKTSRRRKPKIYKKILGAGTHVNGG